MKTVYNFLSIGILISSLLGCSTIMKEELEEFYIVSTPPGAVVSMNNGMKCHTPCSLELERGSDYSLILKKPGFKETKHEIKGSSWDGWLWGNIAFAFALPFAIGYDFYTGYAYDFSPETLAVDLEKE